LRARELEYESLSRRRNDEEKIKEHVLNSERERYIKEIDRIESRNAIEQSRQSQELQHANSRNE